jgi:hypothetical protein
MLELNFLLLVFHSKGGALVQKRKSRFLIYTLAVATLIPLSCVAIYGQSPGGATEAIGFFGRLNQEWCQLVVSPLARRQVTRRLRLLSNSLDDLAIHKQELAELIVSTNLADRQKVDQQLAEFQGTVTRLRRNIDEFSDLLPPANRNQGTEVARHLFDGLSEKWTVLQRVRQIVNGNRSVQASDVSRELLSAVQIILRLKSEINILISQIENSAASC